MADLFPDAEAVAIKHLRTQGIAAGRIYGGLPASPTWPVVTLFRVGGTPSESHRLDVAQIQVDAWGTDKPSARLLAAQARQALKGLEGQAVSVTYGVTEVGGFVSHVGDTIGLSWQPDPETDRARYIFQVSLTIHV